MRRILVSCAVIGVLTLPAAASARAHEQAKPGFLVVRGAAGDGGVNGHPVVTLVVHGFVLGSVKQQAQARVDIYQLSSTGGQGAPQATPNASGKAIEGAHGITHEFSGSGFRFRAMGGYYRVVVRGSGVYLFAGGQGTVKLHGSTAYPRADGTYSINGSAFRSLPTQILKRQIGRG